MKKILGLIALAALFAAPAFAFTYTNQVGQIFEVNITPGGVTNIVTVGYVTVPAEPSAGSMAKAGPVMVILAPKGSATTTTAYTPSGIGCLLIGELTGSTNAVWVATGVTSSSWKKITND